LITTSGGSYGTPKYILSSASAGSMTDYGSSDTNTVNFGSPGTGAVILANDTNTPEPPVGSFNASI